jgi:hypothetical protein
MVNLAVPYARPDRALLTLRDEVYAAYGYTPARASEFVTGYKSATNYTGHNADANGIVHAVDIFTDENGNLPEAPGRELAQQIVNEMARRGLTRGYVIHDMSPGAPWPAIAGAFNGWQWQDYDGSSPHSDHIHVSMCDMYWGDPAPIPASVYDSTEPWNLGGAVTPQSGATITPIQEDLVPNATDLVFTSKDGSKVSLQDLLNSIDEKTQTARDRLHPLEAFIIDVRGDLKNKGAQITALSAAVQALAAERGTDPQEVMAAVREGVSAALSNLSASVELKAPTNG